ncbi:MAG: Transcriptional regulator [Proteobacteria bacterium]|nr:Transcriptional regulator [Pseudomonadota bacterium]
MYIGNFIAGNIKLGAFPRLSALKRPLRRLPWLGPNRPDLGAFPIIAGDGSMASTEPNTWLLSLASAAKIAYRSNSVSGLLAATKAGMGLSALPALAAASEPDLIACRALKSFASPVWLCYHETRKDDPLLRTVASFLGDWIGERG